MNKNSKDLSSMPTSFLDSIKVDSQNIDKHLLQKRFIKEISKDRETLKLLSVDRLKIIEKYYENLIKEYEEKIRKLKSEI